MERISALMDGELTSAEVAKLVPDIKQDRELRDAWATYHLIGDALRGQQYSASTVAHRVSERLDAEPAVLAPRRLGKNPIKRYVLPSLAAAAAVATVTWMSVATQQGVPGSGLAANPASFVVMPAALVGQPEGSLADLSQTTTFVAAPPAVQLPSRPIDAYLLAHQEFSPSTALQGLAPYVRMVANPSGQGR
jgi:sigma-E factor negative regulatory protein RseA